VSRQQAIENIEGCFNEIKLNIILFIQKERQHFMTMASEKPSKREDEVDKMVARVDAVVYTQVC